MAYTALISTNELALHLDDPQWAIVDCRFALAETEAGRLDYLYEHIPGAIYAHLDEHLSGRVIPGLTGRHPLPQIDDLIRTFSEWGIQQGVQVVAYDDAGGALAATRLWWLLRWLGHEAVAVLDGGWSKWKIEGKPVRAGEESRPASVFSADPHPEMVAEAEEVNVMRLDSSFRVIDARSPDRFQGRNETIDPIAGHIPGAVNGPYAANLNRDHTFLPVEELRNRYQKLMGDVPAERTVFYCGSGVTAAHNVFALKYAGLGEARLYPGSWSEWITDPKRPVEQP